MRALVTGADGFVGRWLCQHLEACGDEVWRATGPTMARTARHAPMDVADRTSVEAIVTEARPTVIYHLAAVAYGPDASADIGHAIDVTVRGTAFVLEAARALPEPPVVMVPSSSEVYEPREAAIDEEATVAPRNLYGATKQAQEALGLAVHRDSGLPVVVARAFNHIGPGQRRSFVIASFAAQLAALDPATGGELSVGNLGVMRDFTDVRDVVRAYRLLAAGRHVGRPLNVASGTARPLREVLDQMIAMWGIPVSVTTDPRRVRANDPPVVRGDHGLITQLTGWVPEIPWTATLRDIMDDARQRAASAG